MIRRRFSRHGTVWPSVRWERAFYLLALGLTGVLGGGGDRLAGAGRQTTTPVILISIDTLRADRLGCYGAQRKTTNIDALAKSGTLFSAVSAAAPLTLPSHASLLTSTYPFVHRITDNGQRLAPDAVSLADVLKSHGYRTAAFVGGFVMDRRFGLDQGFDLYDSPFALHRHRQEDPGNIKRLGQDVVDAASRWLGQNDQHPFFLFLHLYDLHTPYNVPASYRERFRGLSGYDAELAYVDAVLGTFWRFLEQRKVLSKALIILTSDHGEGLGDHGESTHGYFIYQSTVSVPLIFRWPDSANDAVLVDSPASLIDVAPTILQFLGISPPPDFQGRTLTSEPRDRKEKAPGIYSETLYGYDHFGVAPLRSLRVGRYKYIEAPRPELYDLHADPHETRNLFETRHPIATSLSERLRSDHFRPFRQNSRQVEAPGPEELELLRSLGYLQSSGATKDSPSALRPDPKERLEEYEAYGRALALASSGRIGESNTILIALIEKDPQFLDARMSLGLNKQRQGFYEQAVLDFRTVLKEKPSSAIARFNLAVSYFELQKWDDAIREADAALRIAPHYTRADELLGTIYTRKKEFAEAESHFNRMLRTAPDDFAAHHNLGVLATMQRRWTEAQQHLTAAVKIDPTNAEAHNSLGSLYLYTDNLEGAVQAFGEAVRLVPNFAWARYNLGLVLSKQGKRGEAAVQFRKALAIDPDLTAARQALTRSEGSK